MITDKTVMTDTERNLRRMLALRVSGAKLYADDGELSDSSEHPFIDFLRDDVDVIAAKLQIRGENQLMRQYDGEEVLIDYTNWKGERGIRRIQPRSIIWDSNEYHREEQWLLLAFDVDKQADRVFAMKDIHMMSGRIDWLIAYLEKT